ncbi:unnamed protein product [Rhodiola kirilowii]
MAVQAHYPSNLLFLNRNLQDSEKAAKAGEPCLDQIQIQSSNMMLFNNNGNVNVNGNFRNTRKRGRDATSGLTTTPIDSYSGFPPQQQPQIVDISQLHNNSNHPPQNLLVSTGLKLSFSDHHQRQQMNQNHDLNHSSFLSDHINHQMKQQQDEIDRLLHLQVPILSYFLGKPIFHFFFFSDFFRLKFPGRAITASIVGEASAAVPRCYQSGGGVLPPSTEGETSRSRKGRPAQRRVRGQSSTAFDGSAGSASEGSRAGSGSDFAASAATASDHQRRKKSRRRWSGRGAS